MIYSFTRQIGFALAASTVVLSTTPVAADDWKPQKPVEMVIMAGQGGGAGAEALRYLKDKSGDLHAGN